MLSAVSTRNWRFASANMNEARRARREVVECLRAYGSPQSDFNSAELICGELIANAVEHAPGRVTVELECSPACAVLIVFDDGPWFAINPTLPIDNFTEHGRGLFLVQSLSNSVHVDCDGNAGKKVVVHLSIVAAGISADRAIEASAEGR